MNDRDTKIWLTIVWLSIAACVIPAYAFINRPGALITAGAEDDCAYYHLPWKLAAVEPLAEGGVVCVYR